MKIQSAILKDQTSLEFADFNVFIGGNAVGKTTLALELYARATDTPRPRWFWIGGNTLSYSTDNLARDLRLLLRSMAHQYEGANLFYFSQAAKNLDGNIDLDARLRFASAEYTELKNRADSTTETPGDVFATNLKYRRPFVSFTSCEARLNLPSQVAMTALNQPPQDAVNVLYRSGDLLEEIDRNIYAQFKWRLSLLDHIRTQLEFGLTKGLTPEFDSRVRDRQAEFARIEKWKQEHFFPLAEVGHGIRSMVKLLMSLLNPVNEVIFIDEPEMHIYPAQKRWLGRQLVLLARQQGKQVFVVTHDPIILQGILDSPAASRIFRIDVDEADRRSIRRCDLEHVTDVGARRNQDSYLQGLFYQRCIAVEGASDRAFYQIMTEELVRTRTEDKDLGFVACGGKGATKNMAYIASRVGLSSAFIYDFDALLFDVPLIREICEIRGGRVDAIRKLEDFFRENYALDEKRIKEALGDAPKRGLESTFVAQNLALFQGAVDELRQAGIFVVPFGQLESWAPGVEPKFRFAEIAPEVIEKNTEFRGRLEGFLDAVLTYLGC